MLPAALYFTKILLWYFPLWLMIPKTFFGFWSGACRSMKKQTHTPTVQLVEMQRPALCSCPVLHLVKRFESAHNRMTWCRAWCGCFVVKRAHCPVGITAQLKINKSGRYGFSCSPNTKTRLHIWELWRWRTHPKSRSHVMLGQSVRESRRTEQNRMLVTKSVSKKLTGFDWEKKKILKGKDK